MVRYAITDRRMFPGSERERRSALVRQARQLAAERVDYLQLRERDLAPRELERLAAELVAAAAGVEGSQMRVLVNGPAHIALAAGAAGVHLRRGSSGADVERARELFAVGDTVVPLVSVSCHSVGEVEQGAAADLVLFGPVFEKRVRGEQVLPGAGLEQLKLACDSALGPLVIALGGVTSGNTAACLAAGADGVAGIRLFQRL